MNTESSATPQGSPRPANEGHERTDVHVGWIFGIIGFLALAGIAIHLLLGGMMRAMSRTAPPTDAWRPVARPAGGLVAPGPPFPRLQVSPPTDMQQFREREDAELNSYGWINRSSGIVRIPIERAMDLVLERGMPARDETNTRRGPSSYELQQQRPAWHQPGPLTPNAQGGQQ